MGLCRIKLLENIKVNLPLKFLIRDHERTTLQILNHKLPFKKSQSWGDLSCEESPNERNTPMCPLYSYSNTLIIFWTFVFWVFMAYHLMKRTPPWFPTLMADPSGIVFPLIWAHLGPFKNSPKKPVLFSVCFAGFTGILKEAPCSSLLYQNSPWNWISLNNVWNRLGAQSILWST